MLDTAFAMGRFVHPIAIVVAAQATSALCPSNAGAEEPHRRTSSLSWVRLEGAERCVSTQALAHAVEDRLERKVFVSASEGDLSVEGHVSPTQSPPGWHAVVSVRDAKGAILGIREVDSRDPSCDELHERLAFVLSVMIDAEAPRVPGLSPPAPQVVVRKETVYVAVEPKPPSEWSISAGAGVAAGVGLLPRGSVGVTASVVIAPPRFWAFVASGSYWNEQSLEAERGARAEVALAHAGLGTCPLAIVRRRFVSRACAGAQVGSLQVRGVGFDSANADERLVVMVQLQGLFGVRVVGPLLATVGLSILVPLAKSELFYRVADGSQRQLFRGSPVAAAGDLGLALVFP